MNGKEIVKNNYLIDVEIDTEKSKLNKLIECYSFYYISDENFDIISNEDINQNLGESETLIINQFHEEEQNNLFIIIGFKRTIFIIRQSKLTLLQNFFLMKTNIPIYLFSDVKLYLNEKISIENDQIEINKIFYDEISNFNDQIKSFKQKSGPSIRQMRSNILSCITGYLIRESYIKLNKEINFSDYIQTIEKVNSHENQNNNFSELNLNKNDYIELRAIGSGSSFMVSLIYQIENGQLFALKKPISYNCEMQTLFDRELKNYKMMNNHLFLPKFYGKVKDRDFEFLIIQFIDGQILQNYNINKLKYEDKIIIIFELIIIIKYFHDNKFIYRDLKPNNIIIDSNQNIFVIDFDRMILFDDLQKISSFTTDFASNFVAPEVNYGKYSYECDIYSLGKMINFIMKELELNKNLHLYNIYKKCISETPKKRPSILELMIEFYTVFSEIINESKISEYSEVKYLKGIFNFDKKYIEQNINKAIQFYTISSDQNNTQSQFYLGAFYSENIYVPRNIEKAIYYYTLAANQNHRDSQLILGVIYSKINYEKQDINKAIHYYELASNQNDPEAQFDLGIIYYTGQYIKRDINKSIYYWSLASDQNHSKAQYNLGVIYYDGKIIKQDMNKSINYFTKAADQNNLESLYMLGNIYNKGEYVTKNINKAIQYFSIASNFGHLNSQFNLGLIYYRIKNIDKAIYYFSLAANKNDSESQYILGSIYHEGKYIEKNITKAIHYYTLAANCDVKAQINLGCIYLYDVKNINKAIYYLSLAAKNNNVDAQINLGIIFYNDVYIKHDIDKSIYYFSLAANQNHPHAQFILGIIYSNNKFIKQDINKSIYYLTLAANQNHPYAQLLLGSFYNEKKCMMNGINKTVHYYELAAKQNNPEAQYNISKIYYEGKYVLRDIKKAIYYLFLSANGNYSEAQYSLGFLYYEGKHVTRDINKSIYYFTLASKQNHKKSQSMLGYIYLDAKYITRDLDKSIYYYSLAANQNDISAQFDLGIAFYFNKDIDKAIYCLTLASNKNLKSAQFALGIIYYDGKYKKRDINKSIHFLLLAASQNDSDAQYLLAEIYYDKKYISQDINKTIHYLTLASNHGHADAQYTLGMFYSIGIGLEKNLNKGIDLFIQSSQNGNTSAHFAVGYFYHEGKYINKNIKKAIHFYKEASSFNNQYAKNNLGIIYKNGFENEIKKNIGFAISYFEETIRLYDDKISKYNLSYIYIYEYDTNEFLDKSIELLIESSTQFFSPSFDLLCIALIKKHGFNYNNIKQELIGKTNKKCKIIDEILQMIFHKNLYNESDYEKHYQLFHNIDFLYDFKKEIIHSIDLIGKKRTSIENKTNNDITSDFYEGFGKDLYSF